MRPPHPDMCCRRLVTTPPTTFATELVFPEGTSFPWQLDDMLPRAAELALTNPSRAVRLAAAEVVHAAVVWSVGATTQQAGGLPLRANVRVIVCSTA